MRFYNPPELFGEVCRYQRVDILGSGTYGRVYKALDTRTRTYVALKRVLEEVREEDLPYTAIREISLARKLEHPNIVRVHDIVLTQGNLYMVYPFEDITLTQWLSEHRVVSRLQIMRILYQIIRGISFIHVNLLTHRDLKPCNIMINPRDLTIKITDFGLGRILELRNKPWTDPVQSLWYRAPEVLLRMEKYDQYVDIWSIGCIFAELLCGEPLFMAQTEMELAQQIFMMLGTPTPQDLPGLEVIEEHLKVFPHYSKRSVNATFPLHERVAIDLLRQMLVYTPSKRISAEDALKHPYFDEVRGMFEGQQGQLSKFQYICL